MTSFPQDIQYKLKRLNVLEWIIVINTVVFVYGFLAGTIFRVSDSLNWLKLPVDFVDFIKRPWTLLTYGFAHYDFWHLLFNLLVLFYVSRLFLNFFKPKMALSVYFMGVFIGGLAFLLVYNLLPPQLLHPVIGLIGASAGVRALLIFLCTYMGETEVRMIFFNIKLKYVGIALVAIDFIGLWSNNQGGSVAHLGGNLLGFVYATQLARGNNIGTWLERIIERIEQLFKKKQRSLLKTVHRKASGNVAGHNKKEFLEFNKQKQVDLILDKISKSGYDSLSKEEKEFLFKAGKE